MVQSHDGSKFTNRNRFEGTLASSGPTPVQYQVVVESSAEMSGSCVGRSSFPAYLRVRSYTGTKIWTACAARDGTHPLARLIWRSAPHHKALCWVRIILRGTPEVAAVCRLNAPIVTCPIFNIVWMVSDLFIRSHSQQKKKKKLSPRGLCFYFLP